MQGSQTDVHGLQTFWMVSCCILNDWRQGWHFEISNYSYEIYFAQKHLSALVWLLFAGSRHMLTDSVYQSSTTFAHVLAFAAIAFEHIYYVTFIQFR